MASSFGLTAIPWGAQASSRSLSRGTSKAEWAGLSRGLGSGSPGCSASRPQGFLTSSQTRQKG
eukprot:439616-Rhodomonas_salina.1